MVAGADSIDDMDVLRHGMMGRLFTGVRAPSTLGMFLRTFTVGHVRQLGAVASRLLIALAKSAPLLPGAGMWRVRAGHVARRQRLLQPRRGRRRPPWWGQVLSHRPDEPHCRYSDL